MYEKNISFTQPSDGDTKIWRYLDFTKFVSLLDTESLFFSNSSNLSDSFEGSVSKVTLKHREDFIQSLDAPPDMLHRIRDCHTQTALECVHVNCWHINYFESAAMWNIF